MPPTPLRSGGGLIAFDMALSSLRSKPAFAPRHGQTRQVVEAGSARSGTGKIRLAARTRKNLGDLLANSGWILGNRSGQGCPSRVPLEHVAAAGLVRENRRSAKVKKIGRPRLQCLFRLQAIGRGAALPRGLEPAVAFGLRGGLGRGVERAGRPRCSQPHWYSAKRFSAPIWSAYSAISRPLPSMRGGRIGWTRMSPSGTPIKEEGESSTTTKVSNETSGAIASSSFKWWMALGSGSSNSTSKESR